ncbi:nucleotide exchange factor GrpE [Candidatus Nomurabacteria bacterium]|nr:nucleotide exchange factor GrpE [Candidatus Nomurabacteria bacterium]
MDEEQDVVFEESDEEGAEKGAKDKVAKLKEKIVTLEKESKEYLDGWQRARADYANLVKTAEEDKKRMRSLAEESFIEELLPVVDSFAVAMSNKEAWEKAEPAWRTGVEYIYQQLMNVLKERSLEAFGAVGELFDPALHHAVSETATDDEGLDHTIASVLQQGYKLRGMVLRPVRVVVYKLK